MDREERRSLYREIYAEGKLVISIFLALQVIAVFGGIFILLFADSTLFSKPLLSLCFVVLLACDVLGYIIVRADWDGKTKVLGIRFRKEDRC